MGGWHVEEAVCDVGRKRRECGDGRLGVRCWRAVGVMN